MKNLKLGLFDTGTSNKSNSMLILNDIINYAIKADELNFSRFWISEHHRSNPFHAYNNPEILLSVIAGMTNSIRVGSAGSLIGYYSPYSLAQNYKLLNNLFENRIDFGLSKGRPSHSDKHEYFNLEKGNLKNIFFKDNLKKICELYHLEDLNYEEHGIVIPPFNGKAPSMWYLSNGYSHQDLILENKLNLCRSLMHGLDILKLPPDKDKLLEFKYNFNKLHGCDPGVTAAIAISFENSSSELIQRELNKNRLESIKVIAVTPSNFKDQLLELQEIYGIDEFVVYDTELEISKKLENLSIMTEIISSISELTV